MIPPGMAGDIIFYQFSRAKVERGDFSHFLGLYAPDMRPAGRRLRGMIGALMFGIEGYDHDPREIHSIPPSAKSSTKMSFTITRNLEQLPSYSMLCKRAEQNHVRLTGNERSGSFSGRGVEGDYEFGEDCIHGTFTGHGVKGEFSFEIGKVVVTITDKPFWLPEMLLKQKITEGLDTLCSELAWRLSS